MELGKSESNLTASSLIWTRILPEMPPSKKRARPAAAEDAIPGQIRVLNSRVVSLNQMPWYANRAKASPELEAVIAQAKEHWEALAKCSPASRDAVGAAAAAVPKVRQEAANQLVRNHEAVLLDLTDRSSAAGVIQAKLTQSQMRRCAPSDAVHADAMLREVARRLLGATELRAGRPNKKSQVAWQTAAKYLHGRLQTEHMEAYSRGPDMSVAAAEAMRAVLTEVLGEL